MDMVEKVARAIFCRRQDLAQWHWPGEASRKWLTPGNALADSNPLPDGSADRIYEQARAAIEAMQNPTEEMIDATAPAHEGERIIAKVMYRAMITVAARRLSDSEEQSRGENS